MRLLLLNPNTNTDTTAAMVDIAKEEATLCRRLSAVSTLVEGATVPSGVPLIYNEEMLSAAEEVAAPS
jgi:Asp/Glu/hydantoin racemase